MRGRVAYDAARQSGQVASRDRFTGPTPQTIRPTNHGPFAAPMDWHSETSDWFSGARAETSLQARSNIQLLQRLDLDRALTLHT